MTTVSLDYIWQAIRDSERSDEFPFLTDEELRKVDAARLARRQHSQPKPVATPPVTAETGQTST